MFSSIDLNLYEANAQQSWVIVHCIENFCDRQNFDDTVVRPLNPLWSTISDLISSTNCSLDGFQIVEKKVRDCFLGYTSCIANYRKKKFRKMSLLVVKETADQVGG